MYRLYQDYAHRYDLHTPPGHYKHDHAFVLEQVKRAVPGGGRLLDVGCGTGQFIEAALALGIDACGLDAAPGMVEAAIARLGPDRVRLERMQELSEHGQHTMSSVPSLGPSTTARPCPSSMTRSAAAVRPCAQVASFFCRRRTLGA